MTPMAAAFRRDSIVLGVLCLVTLAVLAATWLWPALALWTGRVVILGFAGAFGFLAIATRQESRGLW